MRSKPFVQIPHDVIRCRHFTNSEYRVLLCLSSIKPCYPSHKTLEQWTGLDRKTVYRALASLKKKNVINWFKGRTGVANTYTINPMKYWRLIQRGKNGTPLIITREPLFIDESEHELSPFLLTATVEEIAKAYAIADDDHT